MHTLHKLHKIKKAHQKARATASFKAEAWRQAAAHLETSVQAGLYTTQDNEDEADERVLRHILDVIVPMLQRKAEIIGRKR